MMTLREFNNNKLSPGRFQNGKVIVCSNGHRMIVEKILADGVRSICSDSFTKEYRSTNIGGPAWSVVWALKEYYNTVLNDYAKSHAIERVMYKIQFAKCREDRWTLLRQAFKIAGITHYSDPKNKPIVIG